MDLFVGGRVFEDQSEKAYSFLMTVLVHEGPNDGAVSGIHGGEEADAVCLR
jgi:hypothetical protein